MMECHSFWYREKHGPMRSTATCPALAREARLGRRFWHILWLRPQRGRRVDGWPRRDNWSMQSVATGFATRLLVGCLSLLGAGRSASSARILATLVAVATR